MIQRFLQHRFPNGLTLLAEKMSGVRSAAMSLLVPAGGSNDPVGRSGSATILSEWTLRGAGARDSRALTNHLDALGLQRSSSAGVLNTRFGAAALADRVTEGLETYADIVRRPRLEESDFEPACELALASLAGIDDDPRQKLLIKLREHHWPWPLGRNTMGVAEEIEALTAGDLRADFRARYTPAGAVLAVAGDIDLDALKGRVESLFGDWHAAAPAAVAARQAPAKIHFEEQKSEQTHIGLAYGVVSELHPDYYAARLAIEALSGGMSGRLFTEIREKKGLVYSVSASYSSLPGQAAVMGYAGTSNERAQQTLDAFVQELHRLSHGITEDELFRAKIGLKASIIMSNESSSSRAGALTQDYLLRGTLRTMQQVLAALDAVTLDDVNRYLAGNRPGNFTVVIVGPKELVIPA